MVLGGAFREPVWLLGSAVCLALSVGLLVLFRQLPARASVARPVPGPGATAYDG